jgi:DNA-binding TFAR19-related protein (PDSD5 family)
MESIEDIRKQKQEELTKKIQEAQQEKTEEQQLHEHMHTLEVAVKQNMSKEALERYGNIKAADQEKAMKLVMIFGQFMQAGKVQRIDDSLLKQILLQMQEKKEINIRRV